MSYPNFSVATAAQVFPTPTNGVGVPAVVTITGSGVSQLVNRAGDFGTFVAEKLDGQVTAGANAGVQYVAPLTESGTLQLTAGLKDCQGNVVAAVNTITFRSLNGLVNFTGYNNAQFVPPTSTWLPDRVAPQVPVGQTGPGAGNGLVWNANVATVSASGLITSTGGPGFAIIEIRYPLSKSVTEIDGTVNDTNFIYTLLLVTVTAGGTDVE